MFNWPISVCVAMQVHVVLGVLGVEGQPHANLIFSCAGSGDSAKLNPLGTISNFSIIFNEILDVISVLLILRKLANPVKVYCIKFFFKKHCFLPSEAIVTTQAHMKYIYIHFWSTVCTFISYLPFLRRM